MPSLGGDHMNFFDEFRNRYIFNLKIELVTPLHIGTGSGSISPLEADNSVMRNIDGSLVLPGASVKGVFRSTLESILNSISNDLVCNIENSPCIAKSKNDFSDEKKWYEYIASNICEVCSLFGSQAIASHIYFGDAISKNGAVSTRDGVRINRGSETAANGAKYDFELANPGAIFEGELILENVENYQVGYILKIIDLINDGFVRFGGKKSVGLGRVKIDYTLKTINAENVFSSGEQITNFAKFISALNNRIDILKGGKA